MAPSGALMILQRKMAQVLVVVYDRKPAVHGFVAGRSICTNAREHLQRRYVLNVDIENFFPSIHFGRFRGLLMRLPYSCTPEVATTIAQVCFAGARQLPQGAPTSPVVANMLCAGMDAMLTRLAGEHRCTYTRYSDDITFSTTKSRFPVGIASHADGAVVIGSQLSALIERSGFKLHPQKQRLQTQHVRQEVTGLVTNEFLNVRRRYVRQIRSMLHAWKKYGYQAAESEFRARWDTKHRKSTTDAPSYAEVILGKLSFLGMVRGRNSSIYSHLVRRARELDKRFDALMTLDDAVLVLERNPDAFHSDGIATQGTAFALEGVGLVSACHVLIDGKNELLREVEVLRAQNPARRVPVIVHFHDYQLDVAVMRNPFPRVPSLPLGNPSDVRTGDTLVMLGFPHWSSGHQVQTTQLTVTGRARRFGVDRIHVDRSIQSGNSGGPVLNQSGQVVGIAVTGSLNGEHPNAIIPISLLRQRAVQLKITLPAPADSWTTDIPTVVPTVVPTVNIPISPLEHTSVDTEV
jgi:RNA-directed DNA polymerase